MTYAEKIKVLCKARKITVLQLEHDLGFSNGYIGKLKDRIPTDRAIKIARYLGMSDDYFFPDSETSKKESIEPMNPLIVKIMKKAATCSDEELQKILEYQEFLLSKH